MGQFRIRSPHADRVVALRALADSTPYPAERKAATKKAAALIRKHELREQDLTEVEIDPLIRFVFGWRQ